MKLDLCFWALDQSDAERQAIEWIATEPNVEWGGVTESVRSDPRPHRDGIHDRWTVTVALTLRESEQPSLWAAA